MPKKTAGVFGGFYRKTPGKLPEICGNEIIYLPHLPPAKKHKLFQSVGRLSGALLYNS